MSSNPAPTNLLDRIWQAQVAYNQKIRARENPENYEYWMKQYILGALSELGEILDEINWKIHKRGHPVDRHNLGRELADVTKFVLCMWEWSGFSYKDMLMFVLAKTTEMEARYQQDFVSRIPGGVPVLISDIDGTLADYRKAFYSWLQVAHKDELPQDTGTNLAMEIDLGLPYAQYVKYKEQFEADGGYRSLDLYPDVPAMLSKLHQKGVSILAYTARPAQRYSRIWYDTVDCLKNNNISQYLAEVQIGQEQRIARACELVEQGHSVIMLEDDPTTAIRAAAAGIMVFLRDQPYNIGVEHYRILRVKSFLPDEIYYMFQTVRVTLESKK